MAYDIRIPRLGWSMEEGTFVRWLKAPGDRVKPSEPLFELEGEKSVEPVESIDGGILHVPAGAPGEGAVVKVGTLIGWLLADGEAPPVSAPEATPAPAAAPAAAPIHPAPAAAAEEVLEVERKSAWARPPDGAEDVLQRAAPASATAAARAAAASGCCCCSCW